MRTTVIITMFALLAAACSESPTDIVLAADSAADVAVLDQASDVALPELRPVEETAVEESTVPDIIEVVPDTPLLECDPGEGCFLDKCSENAACQSGWCVEHMGEGVCSRFCQDECPAGWSCQQIAGTFPDVVYICVSDFSNLCKPCGAAADCKAIGGADDVCVSYGDEGSFCGGPCLESEDCPWGFSCLDRETVDGVVTRQCVAEAGVCPCTGKSASLALWTPCANENEFGLCSGKRVCTDDGLMDCDAPIPAAEECNGLDDDCDGDTDEPYDLSVDPPLSICADGNDCTADTCAGEEGCLYDTLNEGECVDGDVCTVGDHCENGACVGLPIVCDDSNECTDDSCDGLGGCNNEPNIAECDDDDPCTVADQCKDGVCQGFAIACDCYKDADCDYLDDGNACNGELVCDISTLPHKCEVDPATVIICPEPAGAGSICSKAHCDPTNGQCSMVPDHEGYACDDTNACTIGDKCVEGACQPGVPAVCADNNPCTDDSCDPDAGCLYVPNQVECADGDFCTAGDTCADGACVPGEQIQCDDENLCTDDTCEPLAGCVHSPNAADCDDGNECTVGDHCEIGQCLFVTTLDCNDDNPCTGDSCSADGGCQYTFVDAACDDGDSCTINDQCVQGACMSGPPMVCDDGNPCTVEACKAGVCQTAPEDGQCDDGNACTLGDHCDGGQCAYDEVQECNDDNPCTTDSCNPATGCAYGLNEAPCDDEDVCTTGDHCHLGQCIAGGDLACSDNNPCTDDSCQAQSGCVFTPNQDQCDDGNQCSLDDGCENGWCVGGAAPDCADDNPCTDDKCDPAQGCVNPNNAAPCDDLNECTVNDACAGGQCQGGGPPDCDDNNPCTDDACDSDTGCTHNDNVAGCEDGNACSTGDHCVEGACVTGIGVLECDDENACTDDGCNPDVGCLFVNNGLACDDNDECTNGDVCSKGTCQSGPPLVCDDANTCTDDSCAADTGCVYAPQANCCGNGIMDPGELCDDGNQVDGDGCSSDCKSNGVWAFGEYRPALKCGDFANHGNDYRQYCFKLKGQFMCTGQTSGGFVSCTDLPDGIRFTYDPPASWPMRFTKDTPSCQNYHAAYVKNFSLAIGYANFEVEQEKTGNSCDRTWIDDNGSFKQMNGDSGAQLPYKVRYWN